MSSTSIFKSLRELFPQVDLRILRAISIEHVENINEAIEFILSEVLPVENTTTNTTPGFLRITHGTDNLEQELNERDNGPEHTTILDDKPVSSFGMLHYIGAENPGLHSLVADGTKGCVLGKSPLVFLDANMTLHADTGDMFQLRDEENISVQLDEQTISSTVSDNCEIPMEYGAEKQNNIDIQLNVCNEFSGCSSDGLRPLNFRDLETVVNTSTGFTGLLSLSDVSEKDQNFQDSITETYKDAMDDENLNFLSLDGNYLEISSYENILPTNIASRSGYAVSTDLLEDSFKDAKNNKKSLVYSLESMVSMMQELNLLDGKAEQAKYEALVSGDQILCTVEELQQIVKILKDENNMLSGPVYGERSILSTEVRELQARLLKMSEERSKYLSVIEELFKALEVRQLAAKDAIAAANLEKHEKEEVALKALKEQELMRDALVAESQKLQEEAEENSKLREFLVARGHAVDSLQGEMAIIYEDILSIKEKVYGHIPLTKSLMASYTPSCGSSVNSSDHNSHLTNNEAYKDPQQVETTTNTSLKLLDAQDNSLDDWELFEQ